MFMFVAFLTEWTHFCFNSGQSRQWNELSWYESPARKKVWIRILFWIHRCQNNITLTSSIKFQSENSCTCFWFLGVWCFLFGRLWINQNINRLGSKDFCPFVEKFAGADEAVEQFRGELMDVPLAIMLPWKQKTLGYNNGVQRWWGGEARWLWHLEVFCFPWNSAFSAERKVLWGGESLAFCVCYGPVVLLISGHRSSTVKSISRAVDTSIGSCTAIEVKEVQWKKTHKVQLMVKKYPVVQYLTSWHERPPILLQFHTYISTGPGFLHFYSIFQVLDD